MRASSWLWSKRAFLWMVWHGTARHGIGYRFDQDIGFKHSEQVCRGLYNYMVSRLGRARGVS